MELKEKIWKNGVLLSVLLLLSVCTIQAQQVVNNNTQGTHDGYFYSFWEENNGNQASMTLYPGGRYTTTWNNVGNFTAGKGWAVGSKDRVVCFEGSYDGGSNGFLAVYGWTKDPLIEYYVVESHGAWDPPGNTSDIQHLGSFTSDGGVYDIYTSLRVDKPSIIGTATFEQYWSVRRTKRSSGTVTFANHVNEWEKYGVTLGTTWDYQIMESEGYGSSGSSDITVWECQSCSANPPAIPSAEINYMVGDTPSQLSATGSNLKWYTSASLTNGSTTAPTPSTATQGTTTYYVTQTPSDCESQPAEIVVNVRVPQGPYGGTAHPIPGTIQFEDYDVGGNGSAYYDDSPGTDVPTPPNFRTTEDVDIENCTDTGGGYNIGYGTAGEWLEYTVNVAATGLYNLDLRVACNGTGRTLKVEVGGVTVANNVAIPNTGGWQTWTTVTVNNVNLTAGEQIMRVTIGATDYVNMNFVRFTAAGDVTCDDTDNDGTDDCSDDCPNDPNKITPGDCGCGIAEGTCTNNGEYPIIKWKIPGGDQGMAACKGKFLGNIMPNAGQYGGGSPVVRSDWGTYWNQVTPENSGKWGDVERNRDQYNWNNLDQAYNYAQQNDIPFKQHVFVWGSQQPSWIGSLSAQEKREEVEEWYSLFAQRYPNTAIIDVVNESIRNHAPAVEFADALGGNNNGASIPFLQQNADKYGPYGTGWDYIIYSFAKARQYFPDAILVLNDYGIINDPSAIDEHLAIVKILKDRDLIDAVGIQCHNFNVDNMSANQVKNNLDRLATGGLPIHVTELDIVANQAAKYQELFPVFWEHPAVAGVTLWGYVEGQTWRTGSGILNSNGTEKAAMTWLKQYMASQPDVCNIGTPEVSLSTPTNGSTYTAPADVILTATATDPDGTVASVKFYANGTLLNTDNSSPYSYTWNVTTSGTYDLTAVATDNEDNTATSNVRTITVTVPQGPYNGTPHPIPGTIQLEEYDLGGNGSAYNDDTPGSEVTPVVNYRTNEDVDIENCTDTGGGYNIGWATEGEWLEYTVDVTAAGTYDLEIRYAIGETGSRTIHVEMDGVNLTGAITLPNTGGWQTWQTFTVTDLDLTAGEKIMRVSIDADYVNLNYVTFLAQAPADSDGDGTPDNADACPDDPNKAATAGACGCGTPDTDSDADGIADCNDTYPNDADNDGITTTDDCDDNNAEIGPAITWYEDTDGDGLGAPGSTMEDCTQPTGYVANSDDSNDNDFDNDGVEIGTDCDDANASIGGPTTWYEDLDGDGLGNSAVTQTSCTQPTGYVATGGDNNDTDKDNDGINTADDCDDDNPSIGAGTTWYEDTDGDGVGVSNVTQTSCTQPTGYVATAGDQCPNDINKTTPGNCGCGNTEESCLDCAGTPNGTAFIDNCDNCVATQQEACEQDCNGDWGGTAAIDACNECTGGETGLPVITDPTKCLATGVEEESETMFRVYPNPTTGDLYLPTAKSWYLYNAQGEIIQEGDATYLNLSDHPDGMYFLKTEGNIIKVVKE